MCHLYGDRKMKSRCPSRDKCPGYDRCGPESSQTELGPACLPGPVAPGTFQMAPVTTTRSEMRIKL